MVSMPIEQTNLDPGTTGAAVSCLRCSMPLTCPRPGREVTYQGHAGQGRPVPAPLYQGPPVTAPLYQGQGHSGERQGQGQGQGPPVTAPLYPVPRKTPQNADLVILAVLYWSVQCILNY